MDCTWKQEEPKTNTPEQQNTMYQQDTYLSKYEILEDVQEVQ